MHKKHFPVQIHVAEQAPPIDLGVLLEDEVRNVRAIIAMAQLDEGFRSDQLCRWNDLYRYVRGISEDRSNCGQSG